MQYIKIKNSAKPKYQQIVQSILDAIDKNELKLGDKLPSLKQLCKEFSLSQDTVLRAYNELKNKGMISSAIGKGYYVSSIVTSETHKIFLLFDALTLYKESLYNSILEKFMNKGSVEIFFHHNNKKVFRNLITQAVGNYSSYVIMPILDKDTASILADLPLKKVFLLDMGRNLLGHKYAYVCQRFEKDVYVSLKKGLKELRKYNTLCLLNPGNKLQYKEIQQGMEKFAKMNKFNFKTLKNLDNHKINSKEVYLTINDIDLVSIIKMAKAKDLVIGKDIGIISYNKSPLKEVMANGITTISTDFEEMGRKIADMIIKNRREKIDNKVEFINGGSL